MVVAVVGVWCGGGVFVCVHDYVCPRELSATIYYKNFLGKEMSRTL